MVKNPKLKKSLFDWTRDGITQSSLTRFQACREQFALEYVNGYTPRGFSVPLEFGTIIHLALERQELIGTKHTTAEDVIGNITESYHNARFPQMKSKLDQESMTKTLAAADVLFPIYHKHMIEDDAKQQWIAREQLFNVPYEFPIASGLGSAKINLRGMRDGTYRTLRGSHLGLFETKTKSQIDDNQIQAGLRADLQTMFYLFTLFLETGEYPKQVLYNVIRRPGQKFLERDNYVSFKQRIKDDITKRPDYYFRRWEVNILKHDLDTFKRTVLDPGLSVMLQWWESVKDHPFDRFKSPLHFVSLPALYTKYGVAAMYGLMVSGRVRDYYIRSSVFPELAPEKLLAA